MIARLLPVPQTREVFDMTMKTYRGSCHCGNVKFEADIDLAEGSGKCNCSICTKARLWSLKVRPEKFRLLTPESELSNYQFNTKSGNHLFCKTCGVRPFGWSDIPQAGGKFYSVMATCLDDIDFNELLAAPIKYADGRNNSWWNQPAETRHL
jgi:hypothetical protein